MSAEAGRRITYPLVTFVFQVLIFPHSSSTVRIGSTASRDGGVDVVVGERVFRRRRGAEVVAGCVDVDVNVAAAFLLFAEVVLAVE